MVDRVLRAASYLGTPVLVVADTGDGYVTALWPDRVKPGRSHGREKPFTFNKGEWWRVWSGQVVVAEFEFEPPAFPLLLAPKPKPGDEG